MRKEEGPSLPSSQHDGDYDDVDEEGTGEEADDGKELSRRKKSAGNVEWKIYALVKRKIVFSKRPGPI